MKSESKEKRGVKGPSLFLTSSLTKSSLADFVVNIKLPSWLDIKLSKGNRTSYKKYEVIKPRTKRPKNWIYYWKYSTSSFHFDVWVITDKGRVGK